MTTGKIESVIKCVCRVRYGDNPECQRHLLLHPDGAERARLEREVIRCAKLFTAIKEGGLNATWSDRVALADNDLDDAVRKLKAFEAEHK